MSTPTLVVTGSTGRLDGRVARRLAEAGVVQAASGDADAAVDAGAEHIVSTSFYGAAPDATFTPARDHWTTEDGAIRGPAGQGRAAAVALTLDEVAATLTEVTRRPVRYVPETLDETYASRAGYGAPDRKIGAWVSTYTATAAGELAGASGDVAAIAGHEPRSLAEVLATVESP
jgi:NAD(P)H dehydrogenase (quinone)